MNISYNFNVLFLENDSNKLAALLSELKTHQNKLSSSLAGSLNKKIFKTLQASLSEVIKIIDAIKDRIIFIHHPSVGLSDHYNLIVSYDSLYQLPQAVGLITLNRKNFKERKTIELSSLITAFRNLDLSENIDDRFRVKGAGSSIIHFCKKVGKEHEAKYLYLEAALSAKSFYERFGFKNLNPEIIDNEVDIDPFGMKRISMILDLEE